MLTPCLLALMLAGPQQPVNTNWENPSGVVRDEHGKPIEGATVGVRWLRGRSVLYGRAIEEVLAAAPLPQSRTAADGTYSLALTREHHLLGCGDRETFAFVAEKPGYQRWVEALPGGIRAYRGSQVALLELREADELRFLVRDCEPGMRLLVRRVLRMSTARYDVDPGELVLVPPDGRITVRLPLAPSPPEVPGSESWCLLGVHAQVLLPGRSSDPEACDPGRLNVISAPRPERAAARTAAPWRGLYRCPNGEEAWFAQATAGPEPDEHLRFVRAERDGEPATQPSGAGDPRALGSLKIVVTDSQSVPIAGASVRLGSPVGYSTASLARGALQTDEHGVAIARQLLRTTYHVLAIAPGFAPGERTAHLDSECTLILEPVDPAALDREAGRPWSAPASSATQRGGAAKPAAGGAGVRSVLIAVPPGTTVGASAFRIAGRSGTSVRVPDARGSLGVLLSALVHDGDRIVFTLGDGSALVVDRATAARAPGRGPWLAFRDERGPARSVGLTVRDANGLLTSDVIVVPVAEVTVLPPPGRLGRQLARPVRAGTWVVGVRAAEEVRCLVLHPGHVPVAITIPGTATRGLEVSLEQGSPLTVRVATRQGIPARNAEDQAWWGAHTEVGGYPVLFETELSWPAVRGPLVKGPDVVEIRAPFALPPGKHEVTCGGKGVTVVAEAGRPVVASIE